jgi:hypothetical protein
LGNTDAQSRDAPESLVVVVVVVVVASTRPGARTHSARSVRDDARASDAGDARASRRRAGIVPDASRGPKPTAHAEHPGRCGEM